MAGARRVTAVAAVLAASSTVSWLVLATVPAPPPAAAGSAAAAPTAVGFYPGPQRARLLDAAVLIAGRRRAESAAARARRVAALRARKHSAHLAHLAHDRHLAQIAASAAAARAARQQDAVVPSPQSASSYAGSGSMQQCIIARESGGNSQVMNATGHYGLYQFSYSTWVAHGGNPADFGHASVAEQNQVYYNTVAADGYSDWAPYDGC